MQSHALSRTIEGKRTATVNPNNDPHYYSYKLVGEPAPPPSQPQDDQDDYNIQLDTGDDIEEVELSDSEDINMNGSREEVMARLNKRINNLQNKSIRMNRDLYGDDRDYGENSSTLEHVGSADDIYKNNGGIWDAEILDHISEMREAHNQRMQTIHQNFMDSQVTSPPSTKRGTSPRRASPRVTKYDSSSLYSPQFLKSSRGRNPSPRREVEIEDSREEDEEAENQAWMYVYNETQPYQKSTRRYSFGGIGNSSMVFGKMYKPERPVSSYSKVDYASKVTLQEPFSFNDRSNTPTRSMLNVQDYIREKEDKERVTQFKARPVPASTKDPRYKDITEEQEKRKQYTHAESFAITKSLENPFSFYDRDKEKLEKKKKKIEEEKNRAKEKPPQFKANPVPDFIKQNVSISEDEKHREERISSRAQDTLLQSSLPPRMSDHNVKPSVRKKYEPLKPTHSPQINKSVPNFAALQNGFAEKQDKLKKEKKPTVPEEFSFHTPPKQTRTPFASHSNPLYNFSPSPSPSLSSPPSSPSPHKNKPPPTTSVSSVSPSVSPSLSHSSSHSSLSSPPTSARSPNSSSPNSARKLSSSSGNSPKNVSFPAHRTTLATELKRQMAHKKIEREESEKKKEDEEERERQRKLKAMTKEVTIRLKPFDELLPASIDERTKERKQEQVAKTKEFKQKMADMQEKMENTRLTLFERYVVESAGKLTEKRMDSSLRKIGLDDEDLKARVEKTYGRKYYDKIYGETKEMKKKKVTVRENNSEDEDDDESGSNRYESDSEESDEEQYTKKDKNNNNNNNNNKSDEDEISEEEKKSEEPSDNDDD